MSKVKGALLKSVPANNAVIQGFKIILTKNKMRYRSFCDFALQLF
jgi:hypothetical protein